MNKYICPKCKSVSVVLHRGEDITMPCSTCSPETPVKHTKTLISVAFTGAQVQEAIANLNAVPEPAKPSVVIKPTAGKLIVPSTSK